MSKDKSIFMLSEDENAAYMCFKNGDIIFRVNKKHLVPILEPTEHSKPKEEPKLPTPEDRTKGILRERAQPDRIEYKIDKILFNQLAFALNKPQSPNPLDELKLWLKDTYSHPYELASEDLKKSDFNNFKNGYQSAISDVLAKIDSLKSE